MIVFLDIKDYKVNIYSDKGLKIFSIFESDNINNYIGKNNILYVTNAVNTCCGDLMELLESIIRNMPQGQEKQKVAYSNMVLKSNSKGRIHISDLALVFESLGSFYLLGDLHKKFGKDILEKHEGLKGFIKKHILQVSSLNEAIQESADFAKKKKQKEDQVLDSILINETVDSYMETVEGGVVGSDAIEIEVNSIGSSGSNNESSLFPEE